MAAAVQHCSGLRGWLNTTDVARMQGNQQRGASRVREAQFCIICGERLKRPPWWMRWFVGDFPAHKQQGAEGDACWVAMNKKMGNENPGPRPA